MSRPARVTREELLRYLSGQSRLLAAVELLVTAEQRRARRAARDDYNAARRKLMESRNYYTGSLEQSMERWSKECPALAVEYLRLLALASAAETQALLRLGEMKLAFGTASSSFERFKALTNQLHGMLGNEDYRLRHATACFVLHENYPEVLETAHRLYGVAEEARFLVDRKVSHAEWRGLTSRRRKGGVALLLRSELDAV